MDSYTLQVTRFADKARRLRRKLVIGLVAWGFASLSVIYLLHLRILWWAVLSIAMAFYVGLLTCFSLLNLAKRRENFELTAKARYGDDLLRRSLRIRDSGDRDAIAAFAAELDHLLETSPERDDVFWLAYHSYSCHHLLGNKSRMAELKSFMLSIRPDKIENEYRVKWWWKTYGFRRFGKPRTGQSTGKVRRDKRHPFV